MRHRTPDRRSRSGPAPGWALSLARTACVAAGLLFVITLNLTPITESDFWIQLKVGDAIRETGTIPRTIQFAFTEARDREFFAHEWLPSVVTSAVHARVGYRGTIAFKCALAVSLWALAILLCLQVGRGVVVSVLIASVTLVALDFRVQMRPELFAFVLALGSLNLLVAFLRTGARRWLIGLVPIGLLWANSHGSFLLNLALPWIFLAGTVLDDLRSRERSRVKGIYLPLAAAGIALLGVSLLNPYGLRLWTHVYAYGQADYLREHLVEFGSTFDERVRAQSYFQVYVAYLGALVLSFVAGWRNVSATSLLVFAVFGWLSTDAIRFTAWLALTGTYVLARNLGGSARAAARGAAPAVALAAGLVLATAVVYERGNVRGHRIGLRHMAPMSEAAIEFVRGSGIEGNVFNAFSHGDQLIYHFWPRIRVAMDSRVDAYGEEHYLRHRSLCGRSYRLLGPRGDLTAFLDRYGVSAIVTRPLDYNNWVDKGHADALLQAGWKVVFVDESTVVLRRGSASVPGALVPG